VSAAQITTAERARRSVRGRLMMVVLVTTAIAVLLAGIAMLTQDLLLYRRAWVSDLSTEARILALSTAPAVAFDDEAAAERNLAALQPRTSVLVAAVYGASGNLYSAYVRPGEPPPPAHMFPQGEGSRMVGNRTELTQPITRNGEVLGTIYLRARYDVVSRIQGYLSIFALVTLICMAVALALSNALQKSLTEPLQAMTRVARQIVDRRDYSLRVAESTGDEIGIVIDAFNGMLDEVQLRSQALEQSNSALQNEVSVRQAAESALSLANARLEIAMKALIEADQRKDEFLATLAHELRNPLAPIRHAVKLLDAEGADETQRKWGREVIARQVHRMALLLDDLLDVSRITRGRLELKVGHVSLESLVSSAVETARPLLDAKKHDLEVSLPAVAGTVESADQRREIHRCRRVDQAYRGLDAGGAAHHGERQRNRIGAGRHTEFVRDIFPGRIRAGSRRGRIGHRPGPGEGTGGFAWRQRRSAQRRSRPRQHLHGPTARRRGVPAAGTGGGDGGTA
jgi:signal transduction histidine kinase